MKKVYCALFLCLVVSTVAYSQSAQNQPWGIWNIEPLGNFNGPRRGSEETGKYYLTGIGWIWILLAPKFSEYPVFYYDGSETKIKEYEETTDGFIFCLIGTGVRYNPITGYPESFRDNILIKVKLTFISRNECVFDYPDGFYHQFKGHRTGADKDGFVLQNTPRTDTIYRRYPVKDEP